MNLTNPLFASANKSINDAIQYLEQTKKTVNVLETNQNALRDENRTLETKIKQRKRDLRHLEQQIFQKNIELGNLSSNNNMDINHDDLNILPAETVPSEFLVKPKVQIQVTKNDDKNSYHLSSSIKSFLEHIGNIFRKGVKVADDDKPNTFLGTDGVDYILFLNLAASRRSAVELLQTLAFEVNLFKSVKGNYEFSDADSLYYFVEVDDSNCETESTSGDLADDEINLTEIAERFKKSVVVKDRMYHLKTYKSCFVGSEAVDYLVYSGTAASRPHACQIGNALMQEFDLFEHVVQDHHFKDKYLFYRFRSTDDSQPLPDRKGTLRGFLARMSGADMKRKVSFGMKESDLSSSSEKDDELVKIGRRFRCDMKVQDHVYNEKTHHDCFTGSQAVDYLLISNTCGSREHAVEVGNALMKEHGMFEHVAIKDYAFKDDDSPYRFIETCVICRLVHALSFKPKSLQPEMPPTNNILDILEQFQNGVDVSDRQFHDKTYQKCFIGSEAVDFMIDANIAESRTDAVKIGNTLMTQFHLFEHVTRDHRFKDEYLFYFFPTEKEDSTRKSLSYGRMNLSEDGLILTREEVMEKRHRQGFCLECDEYPVRLYDIERSKLNPLISTRKPRTVDGECINGKCLHCHPNAGSIGSSSTSHSAPSTINPTRRCLSTRPTPITNRKDTARKKYQSIGPGTVPTSG